MARMEGATSMTIEEAKDWILHYEDEIQKLLDFIQTNNQES
jgi:hypothetical protein